MQITRAIAAAATLPAVAAGAAVAPASAEGNDLATDPQPGTDDASCQALTLASFGEGPLEGQISML